MLAIIIPIYSPALQLRYVAFLAGTKLVGAAPITCPTCRNHRSTTECNGDMLGAYVSQNIYRALESTYIIKPHN